MKPENLRHWTIHIYLMFLSREIDIKLCQNYANVQVVTWFRRKSRDLYTACTAIGWSSGDVIRTIRTICNYISNYIYSKCKMQNKKSCSNLFLNSCRKDLQKVYASHDYPDVHCPMNYRSLHTLHSTWISTN